MARRPNYGFERRQRELKRAARRDEREQAKQARAMERKGGSGAETPDEPESKSPAPSPEQWSTEMRQAANGDTVRVHYTGTLDDGTEFDSSIERDPLEVTVGDGQVLPAIEAALIGMMEGESKRVTVSAADAYGEHDPSLIHVVDRGRIPDEIDLQMGTALQATDSNGDQIRLVVVGIDDDKVRLDANHPLAGKALTFDMRIVEFVA